MGWEVNEDGSYCRSAPRSCSCPETIALPVIIASGVSWPSALSILMNYGIVPCPKLAREKGTLCKLVLGRLKLAVLRVTPFLYFTVCIAMKTCITRWRIIFHESTNVPCDAEKCIWCDFASNSPWRLPAGDGGMLFSKERAVSITHNTSRNVEMRSEHRLEE